VREALIRLREVGLIEPDGARGNRVVRPSPDAFRQAYELREALESLTAKLAARRATPDQVEAILGLATSTLERAGAGDVEAFRESDRDFHAAIAESAGNPRAKRAIGEASDFVRALRERDIPAVETIVQSAQAHVRIANAIRDSAPKTAEKEMRAHIRYMADHVVKQPVDG
jgi:DNA-binding GntR family transcriptional regulator